MPAGAHLCPPALRREVGILPAHQLGRPGSYPGRGTNMGSIYALLDPRTNELRYVGKTTLKLEERLHQHVLKAQRPGNDERVYRWIRSLKQTPMILLLEQVRSRELNAAEQDWIIGLRSVGYRLTNLTDGGDGGSPSRETREEISRTMTGRKQTPEHRRHVREAVNRPEVREKKRAAVVAAHARPGVKARVRAAAARSAARPEVRDKISKALKGREFTDEHRRKISEGRRAKLQGGAVRSARVAHNHEVAGSNPVPAT